MRLEFVKIINKWSEINRGYSKCCSKECILNKNKIIGNCTEGNGYGNLINDEIIKYVVKDGGYNKYVCVYAENSFNKPQNCFNYSLHYFEIKCKLEGRLSKREQWMFIGIQNLSTNKNIYYYTNNSTIYNEKCKTLKLSTIFNNKDIFGCGLVYPPTNMTNKWPYIFFTQNGKQIGRLCY
uniref:Uncharacterized protein n=1 Tax=Meloidogyne enterolobii TaxID=390850 RepID=A0A6V7XLF4_MELEN|nr:unnamed protein product [Meloidogyne enterolobii]